MNKGSKGGQPEAHIGRFNELRYELNYLYEFDCLLDYKRQLDSEYGPQMSKEFVQTYEQMLKKEADILEEMRSLPLDPYQILGLKPNETPIREELDSALIATLKNILSEYESMWQIERSEYILSQYSSQAPTQTQIDLWGQDHAIQYGKVIEIMRQRAIMAWEVLQYEYGLLPRGFYR